MKVLIGTNKQGERVALALITPAGLKPFIPATTNLSSLRRYKGNMNEALKFCGNFSMKKLKAAYTKVRFSEVTL